MRRPASGAPLLLCFVAAAACGHVRGAEPVEPFDAAAPALPTLHDVIATKRAAPGGALVGQTQCGTTMVIRAREGASTRVSVAEETFWIDDADLADALVAERHCLGPVVMRDPRVSDALARSLTPPMFTEVTPSASFDETLPRRFYRLDEERTSCVDFRIEGGSMASDSVRWGFSVERPRELQLTGPTIKGVKTVNGMPMVLAPDPGGEVSYLCLTNLFVARHERGSWDVLRRTERGAIWAYATASAVRWHATRAACEATLKRGPVAKIPFRNCG